MLENINTCMYSYTIGYNSNVYKNLVSNYPVDNKNISRNFGNFSKICF